MYCKQIKRECLFHKECNTPSIKVSKDDLISKILNEDFIESIGIINNTRKVRKMEDVEFEDIPILKKRYQEYNTFVYTYSSFKKEAYTFLIGKSEANIIAFARYDLQQNRIKRIMGTGLLLGYPKCCITKHISLVPTIKDEELSDYSRKEIFQGNTDRCKLLSPDKMLYVHKPCSMQCKSTIDICEKNLSYIGQEYGYDYVKSFFNI